MSRLADLMQQTTDVPAPEPANQAQEPTSRLSGLLAVEPPDPSPAPDNPVIAAQRAKETLGFAAKEGLAIDEAENLFDEYSNWKPADPDDLPELPLSAIIPQPPQKQENPFGYFEAAPEKGFFKRFLLQGYDGFAPPERYFKMNWIQRKAFDAHMFIQHHLHRTGATAARNLGLMSKEDALELYGDELRNNPRWFEKAPEAVGWSTEKAAEFYVLSGIFRATGLSGLLNKAGQRLARPFMTAQLAERGAETVSVLSREGAKKLGQDALVAFLKHAPENIAFLSTWEAGSAALTDEDISDAATSGALWGAGFSALTPAMGAVGKAFMATPAGQRVQFAVSRAYTYLWQNYPRMMNLGRKPFSDEFMKEAERQFRSRFGVEPTPADREALKKVTRMWGDMVTKQAEQDAAARAYWEYGKKAAQGTAAQTGKTAAADAGTAIVKTATGEIHPGSISYGEFFTKYGQELSKPEGSSEWLDRYTNPDKPEGPRQMYQRLRNEAILGNRDSLPEPAPSNLQLTREQTEAVLNNVVDTVKAVPRLFMRILEPSKAVERKFGKQTYGDVIKGTFGSTEKKLIEFDQTDLYSVDKNIGQLGQWFDQFPTRDLKHLMMSRGNPIFPEAQIAKDEAFDKLPLDLQSKHVRRAIKEIADMNYQYLQKVAGDDITKVKDYFYGLYKNPEKVDDFLSKWYKTTKRFTKEKKLPTVADAVSHGLELKSYNPVENLRSEFAGIARLEGMQWLRDELMKNGQGVYIDNMMDAPEDWVSIGNEPVFGDLRAHPDLARMINNLISTNKVSQNKVLRGIRGVNNFLRTIKFAGSGFHLMVEASQAVADNPLINPVRKSTLAGLNKGFGKDDPTFKTPEYQQYVELGGGHRYSIESEAQKQFNDLLDTVYKSLGPIGKGIKGISSLPVPPLPGFVKWMFDSYIPKLKYVKYLDEVSRQEAKLDRTLTEPEKIDIIKEGQNFYGEMNERLFGRSGTATSVLRFIFLAPGFAEGNYRTILKSVLQWGISDGHNAARSRANIINSLLLKAIAAGVGTLILTGKLPESPESLEDMRDIWKIDTGLTDDKGRKVMLDTLTYDKDYANFITTLLQGRPDKFVMETYKRLGGMKAPLAEIAGDLFQIATGKVLYDWKGDRVVEITDTFSQKLMKLVIHELKNTEPITVSTYRQAQNKDVDELIAFVQAVSGIRPTLTEEEKRKQEVLHRIYSLKGQQEELYQYLRTIKHPREAIAAYNETVQRILNSKLVPQEMRDEWGPQLLIDTDRLIKNKHEDYASPAHTLIEAQRIREFLVNFGETPDGLWEGPGALKQQLSDFTDRRRELLQKEQDGTLTLEETARLKMYRGIEDKLSKIAKQISATNNMSLRNSYFTMIETLLSSFGN